MTPALQAFIDELAALQARLELLEAENAVLKNNRGIQTEVRIYGLSIQEIGVALRRLERFDRAAKEST
jgi:hypothetical protein